MPAAEDLKLRERIAWLVSEGLQEREHVLLVRAQMHAQSGELDFVTTRRGRAALERGEGAAILAAEDREHADRRRRVESVHAARGRTRRPGGGRASGANGGRRALARTTGERGRVSAPRLDDLADIEAIRQLKVRYCLGVDGKDWSLYRSCFTDDARLGGGVPGGDAGEPSFVGPDDWVATVAATVGTVKTLHTVHASIIEITGPGAARGLWQYTQRGWGRTGGYYTETYRRADGAWRIASMRITAIFASSGEDSPESARGSFDEVAALWPPLCDPWRD